MTNVAYLLFTFLACLAGLGLGLALNRIWTRTRVALGKDRDPFAATSGDDTSSWDAYTKWQSDNNRAFATQVMSCGAAPVVLAGLAWTQRSDVVHSICGKVTEMVGQAYICM
jgi:hypothetical protein